jgi:hypothetical protein
MVRIDETQEGRTCFQSSGFLWGRNQSKRRKRVTLLHFASFCRADLVHESVLANLLNSHGPKSERNQKVVTQNADRRPVIHHVL